MKEEEDVEISNLPVRFVRIAKSRGGKYQMTKVYMELKIKKWLFEKDEM